MWHRLSLVTGPTTDALSLAEAKAHLRVDHDDEDALIGALVDAAIAMIDGPDGIGFAMEEQTWALSLDRFPTLIRLALRPVTGVTEIRYLDGQGAEQTLDPSDYRVALSGGEARVTVAPDAAWPATYDVPGAVTVEFTAGEGVPAPLKAAMLLTVGDLYHNREAATAEALAPNPAVEAILTRYRSGVVAG